MMLGGLCMRLCLFDIVQTRSCWILEQLSLGRHDLYELAISVTYLLFVV